MKPDETQTIWNEFVNNEDQQAFYKLYRHYFHYLTFIGLKKGFDTETIKDSISEVFLHFWEKRLMLGHITNPHNYITTVFLRKIYREEKLVPFSNEVTGHEETSLIDFHLPSSEENFINKESAQQTASVIGQYLEQLPPRQREIIYQKFFLGLSYQEIAKANSISANTVYNTVYAAMDKLRNLLPKNLLFSLLPFSAIVCACNF